MNANDIFISYSTKNTDIAKTIRDLFQSHGITCWMLPESIPAGSNYTKEIPYGILYSKLAVLILSRASLESVWVNQEISYLLDAKHPIIPFIVDDIFSHPNLKEEPFANIFESDSLITRLENDKSWNLLLYNVQKQLAHIVNPQLPNTSDDYLQLGLRDIKEDGGMLFDDGRAIFFLTKSAELGNVVAMRHLARLEWDDGDENKARLWWEKAAEHGDIPAQIHEASYLLKNADENFDNISRATDMVRDGVKENHPEACCLFGELLSDSRNKYFDPTISIKNLKHSLDLGYLHAACILGKIYKEGKIVDEDPKTAFEYFKIASDDANEREASLLLADCYATGYGTSKDLKLAFEGYQKNCYFSDEYIEKYADCYLYGHGVKPSKKKALEMYNSIYMDDDFETILKSELKLRVLKKKIMLGEKGSQSLIGDYYYSTGDYTKAIAYYKKANEEDDTNASIGLALCYLNGHGVHFDYIKAFNLFSKAFALKNQKAAKYLADCYRFGVGTEKDATIAKYFENISCQPKEGLWSISFIN